MTLTQKIETARQAMRGLALDLAGTPGDAELWRAFCAARSRVVALERCVR